MIAILDYGSGNLRSAQRAFELTGHEVRITSDPTIALSADGLVVPGVVAFAACMQQLEEIDGSQIIRNRVQSQKPILGICVGMQILFGSGSEKGSHAGVGILEGEVSELHAPVRPHIGWNTVKAPQGSKLFAGISDESFYFVHSYAAVKTNHDALIQRLSTGKILLLQLNTDISARHNFTLRRVGEQAVA